MIPEHVRIFVCTTRVDMRGSFDRLSLLARQAIGEDIRGGAVCCFVNKRGTLCKVLWWDRNGLCILYKRLHGARFVVPSASATTSTVRLDRERLATLIAGVDHVKKRKIRLDS